MAAAAEPPTAEEALADIEVVSQTPLTLQHELLKSILEKHGRCHYLEKLGLEGKTDVDSFKAAVPLSTYADYKGYIERLKDGDMSHLLCCSPPVAFSVSSGTTAGVSKYFPVTGEFRDMSLLMLYYSKASLRRTFPSKLPPGIGKTWATYSAGKRTDTKSGLKSSTISAVTMHFESYRQFYEAVLRGPSPIEVLLCPDMHQAMYAHLLCALCQRSEIEGIDGLFAFSVVELVRALKRLWPRLCYDIRNGQVNEEIVTDSAVRNAVLSKVVLSPNPEAADLIRRECEMDNWDGILLRLFPNLQYIVCTHTGSMAPFASILDDYTRKGFPKVGYGYGSSELGFPAYRLHGTDPDSFVLWPRFLFYEFIPQSLDIDERVSGTVHNEKTAGTLFELTEVQVGQEYELVITTASGLYRYQMEDILRVTGFYKSLPIFKFVCRKGVALSINTDKTDEAELQMLIDKVGERSKLPIENFTSHADHSSTPGHYIIFLEIEEQLESPKVRRVNKFHHLPWYQDQALQECCDMMDSSLNEPYRRGRRHGFIGPLELRIVRCGTFSKLKDLATKGVGTASQYKSPRCVVNPSHLALLREETLNAFHSLWKAAEPGLSQ